MARSKAAVVFALNVVLFIVSLIGSIRAEETIQQPVRTTTKTGILPFLQFTNDGVRVNLGGYHAEVGLGGLLGGADAKGGLHASAGTPTGEYASAGLGGDVNGETVNADGGLYANAGVGNNGPKASAGLGGLVEKSGNSQSLAEGIIYSDSTTNTEAKKKLPSGRTNIQIISKSKDRNDIEKTETKFESHSPVEIPTSTRKYRWAKEQNPIATPVIATAGLQGALVANVGLIGASDATVSKSVEKVKISDIHSDVIENEGISAGIPDTTKYAGRTRLYIRKRHRIPTVRKQTIYTSSESNNRNVPFAATSVVGGAASHTNANVEVGGATVYKSGSLFDDIFNIPISTLTAVNKLLNNNVG